MPTEEDKPEEITTVATDLPEAVLETLSKHSDLKEGLTKKLQGLKGMIDTLEAQAKLQQQQEALTVEDLDILQRKLSFLISLSSELTDVRTKVLEKGNLEGQTDLVIRARQLQAKVLTALEKLLGQF